MKNWTSFISGFAILLFIYHFPEFFQSFWITALFKVGFLIAAIILCRLQGWKGLEGYGLPFRNRWHALLGKGLLIGFISFAISILLSIAFRFEHFQGMERLSFFLNKLPLILLMTFFPSIAEDILTRGYLYGHLKSLKPVTWIFLSAAVYVLNHFWRLNEGLPVMTYLFLLGLVLGCSVVIEKSLWWALGIHWGANIAYELAHAGIKLTATGYEDGPTWSLAMVWGGVLASIVFTSRSQLLRPDAEILY